MPRFRYKARSSRGDALTGEIEAPSAEAVAGQLLSGGVTPVDIVEVSPSRDVWTDFKKILGADRPGLDDLILLCRQLHALTRAGVPITRGIAGLSETTRNVVLREVLEKIQAELEAGRELSYAMGQYPTVFTPLMISMVRVGENTGRLDEAFGQLAQYLELDRDTRDRVKQALRYPSFVLAAISAAIVVVNIWVIPRFAAVFKSMHVELPWQTQLLIGISEFMQTNWQYLLGAGVIGFIAARQYVRSPDGKYRWDKFKLRIPVTGSLVLRATLSRFARAFAMATRAGVPLIQTLTTVARAVDNDYVGERVLSMRNAIERGETLTRTAVATGLFTPLVIQMLSVGEETGGVETMMAEVADFYDRQVEYDLKNLSGALEPILIVAVGVLVLILALGIFLPMWDLGQAAIGRPG